MNSNVQLLSEILVRFTGDSGFAIIVTNGRTKRHYETAHAPAGRRNSFAATATGEPRPSHRRAVATTVTHNRQPPQLLSTQADSGKERGVRPTATAAR